MTVFVDNLRAWHKTALAMSYDFFVALMAFYLAFVLRLGDWLPSIIDTKTFFPLILIVAFTQSATFYFNGLYKGLWRYSSTPDLLRVIRATLMAVVFSFIAAFIFMRLENIPRSLFFIDALLLVMGLGGGRFVYRMVRDHLQYGRGRDAVNGRVLIVGAGSGGDRLLREIKRDDSLKLFVVGFVDDNSSLHGKKIHDVQVFGSSSDLPSLIEKHQIQKVFIAIPSASSKEVQRIYNLIKPYKVEIKILPRMSDIFQGKVEFTKLEEIKIEDLLGREEIELELTSLAKMLQGKKVLVTGAGGSIGSELCEQLAYFNPKKLVALDLSEYNTYALDQLLKARHPELNLQVIVGDVRDQEFMDHLFSQEKPEVVIHAAAYKHVPLMEFNPYQAIQTNVLGTKIVAELAQKYQAHRFVLVSTDKAVNPTNLMGASKRVAEMVVEHLNKNINTTKMVAVRFGNVLGSSGSVIPLFRKQIQNGGPLTVTHPEITRFFMSIPEASKLVLQAGAMGSGGELFVLDMGQPVKIMDMAREMISLAGLHEGVDIEIKVTGLRPGEKLFEEPLMELECALETPHPKVKVCKTRQVNDQFCSQLEFLLRLKSDVHRDEYIKIVSQMVPEYTAYQDGSSQFLN